MADDRRRIKAVRETDRDTGQAGEADEGFGDEHALDSAEPVSGAHSGTDDKQIKVRGSPMGISGEVRASRVIDWIERYCVIPEGRDIGKPVRLRDFQIKVTKGIYGSPTRRAIISYGRKNAKTSYAAFLLLVHLAGPEARPNSQLYSAAQSRDQAALLFALAAKIVRMSPKLRNVITIRDTAKQLYCEELGTLYRALSAEATTAYGLSPVFAVHDELGQVVGPRSALYEAIETGAGAQEEPLSIVISTQAPNDSDLLSILIDDAKTKKDKKTKLFLYTAPEDLDPFSLKAMKAANPALGDFLNETEVRETAEAARRMPAREAAYRNLILNQRASQLSPFVPRMLWEACAGGPDESVFENNPVYIGLDLSARNDLTALVRIAHDGSKWHVKPEFFVPLIGIEDRSTRDRVPYDYWAQQGWVETCPGSSVEYGMIARRLVELCEQCSVQKIAFDRWRIDVLQAEIARLNVEIPLEPFGQGYKDMSPALESFESELINKRFLHGGHPVLTWCAANAIAISDPAGNRKLDKSKSSGRIDGIVALVMALGQAVKHEDTSDLDDFLQNAVSM